MNSFFLGDQSENLLLLLDFFLSTSVGLTNPPICGKLTYIYALALKHAKDKEIAFPKHPHAFLLLLLLFNEISGHALLFNCDLSSFPWSFYQTPTLLSIDFSKLKTLQFRLSGTEPRAVGFKLHHRLRVDDYPSARECLMSVLNRPLCTYLELNQTTLDVWEDNNIADYRTLTSLLAKSTAQSILTKHKAKLKAPNQSFYDVCNHHTHSQLLANFGLNSNKSYLFQNETSWKQSLSQSEMIFKLFEESQGSIGREAYECAKKKTHYLPLIKNHTDVYLGDCSYLDTCHKMKSCRYVHYFTLYPRLAEYGGKEEDKRSKQMLLEYTIGDCFTEYTRVLPPPQWINCDVRYLPFQILGKFAAIVADPAWDIHMSLPYGTCKDAEFLSLPVNLLQDEGILLLWVTGRSIEIGRKALVQWGYTISDELIWVKLNQLRRTIVTGRTGHWLNHSKEHLLVGLKGKPTWINKKMDIDIILSGTRQTLRKPDEVYDIVERIVGRHARKLEIFGRDHNVRLGWISKYTAGCEHSNTNNQPLETSFRARRFTSRIC